MKKRSFGWRSLMLLIMAAAVLAVPALAAGEGGADANMFYETIWSLLPPVIAIALALITKEVYSSLFVGILAGGLMYSGFSFEGTLLHVFNDGIVASVTDSWNMGILVFLVVAILSLVVYNVIPSTKNEEDFK